MANRAFEVDTSGLRALMRRVNEGARVFAAPFADDRAKEAARIIRFGPKGIQQQFNDATEYKQSSAFPWAPTKAFGNFPPGPSPMVRSGGYKNAWLGSGAGSVVTSTDTEVRIGISASAFPQVKIHQGRAKQKRIKVTPKMRLFLGLVAGVWLTKEKTESGIVIARRRLSISTDVRREVARMLKLAFGRDAKLKVRVGGAK